MAENPLASLSVGLAAAVASNNVEFIKSRNLHVVKFLYFIDLNDFEATLTPLKGNKKMRFSDGENEADIMISASGMFNLPRIPANSLVTILNIKFVDIDGKSFLVAQSVVPGTIELGPSPQSSAAPAAPGTFSGFGSRPIPLYGFGSSPAEVSGFTPVSGPQPMLGNPSSVGITSSMITAADVAMARSLKGGSSTSMPAASSQPVVGISSPQSNFSTSSTSFTFPVASPPFSGFSGSQTPTSPGWAPNTSTPSTAFTATAPPVGANQPQPARFNPGAAALAQIRAHQLQGPQHLIHKLGFLRLLRDIFQRIDPEMKIQSAAAEALQEAAEAFMVGFMEDANLVAIQDKMVTVLPDHMRRAMRNRAAASGVTIPDGPITSANILRLVYGMEMKEDHDGDSEDEESDEGGDPKDDSGEDVDDVDMDEDDEEDPGPPAQSSLNVATTNSAPHGTSDPSGVTVHIGDRLKEYLLKSRSPEDVAPLNQTISSSADESLPSLVAIEDLRSLLRVPDSVQLQLRFESGTTSIILDPSKSIAEQRQAQHLASKLVLEAAL
eukprot:TRINITY_DN837_c0_g2_i1.p1 TRINITY_DN837_c0_g2~~TRINITY_DN837_c0_g2_i1.p1  ORF type:complete len:552 (-),score=101.65 TRINITY_DN837_c0_g2_i1:29-1684(-)